VPAPRAVLVAMPHLLADIIRRVLVGRAGFAIVTEIAEPQGIAGRLRELAPDVVIIGRTQALASIDADAVRAILPRASVLALSADLRLIAGPEKDAIAEFTADTLAELLRR
jgi:AmiR/NasT family two-component response regulator